MLSRAEFEKQITSRKIFYFTSDALQTKVPHYFICIMVQPDKIINLSCCTSQFESVKRLIEKNRFPHETLVYIPQADPENPFRKDTYVNCNEYFQYSIDEFWELYYYTDFQIIGDLPLHSFEQILIGFMKSDVIEQEYKDLLPNIDDIDP